MATYTNQIVVIDSGKLKKISSNDFLEIAHTSVTGNVLHITTGSMLMSSGNLEVNGNVTITGSLTLNNANIGVGSGSITGGTGTFNELHVSGSTTIMGDLTVNGTTTTINSSVITIDDPVFMVNKFNNISNTGSLPSAIGELEGIGFDYWKQESVGSSLITSGSVYLITATGTFDWSTNTFGAPTGSIVEGQTTFTATTGGSISGVHSAAVRQRVESGFFGFSNELNAFTVVEGDYSGVGELVAGSSSLGQVVVGKVKASRYDSSEGILDGSNLYLYPSGTNESEVLSLSFTGGAFNITTNITSDLELRVGSQSILKLDSATNSVVFEKEAGVLLPTTSSNEIVGNRVLCLDTAGKLKHSDADNTAVQELIGVSLGASSGDDGLLVHTIFGAKVGIEKDPGATGSYTVGQPVYLSTDDAGGYVTNVAPTGGYVYRAGIVVADDLEFTTVLWMPKLVADLG